MLQPGTTSIAIVRQERSDPTGLDSSPQLVDDRFFSPVLMYVAGVVEYRVAQ